MNIQRYPFDIRPDGDKLGLYIDENSDLLGAEGTALFNEDGEASELLQNRLQFMDLLANSERLTAEFIKKVVELELLTEKIHNKDNEAQAKGFSKPAQIAIYNYLKVQKEGSKYKFYINSKLVYTSYSTKFYGDRVGFIVYDKIKILRFILLLSFRQKLYRSDHLLVRIEFFDQVQVLSCLQLELH